MEKLQLEEIRRNYFDPKAAVTLAAHKLEIWPGYVTSIRQHEEQILLCCEVSCKVLRLVFNCRIVVDIKMFLTVPALLGLTLSMTKSRRFTRGWAGDPTSIGVWRRLFLEPSSSQDTTTRPIGWTRSTGRRLPLTSLTGETARRCPTRSTTPRSTTRPSGILSSL